MGIFSKLFLIDGRVCPSWFSFSLNNYFRKIIHDPFKILGGYIKKGDTVIDVGCGPGYFSIPSAKMAGNKGKVICVDIQEKMLEKLKANAVKSNVIRNIKVHRCKPESLGLKEKGDFVLTFWMVHEVPDLGRFFTDIKKLMKKSSLYFLVEPKIHVTKKRFNEIVSAAGKCGFKVKAQPKVSLSRSALFRIS
jgi:ubiquinone/menaquinone biosynthesis C-methylase UbiE